MFLLPGFQRSVNSTINDMIHLKVSRNDV